MRLGEKVPGEPVPWTAAGQAGRRARERDSVPVCDDKGGSLQHGGAEDEQGIEGGADRRAVGDFAG
jgi:hypothetical protein